MAEINLERKQGGGGMGWLWALLALVVIALIAWWLWPEDEMEFDDPVGVETVEPMGMQPAMPDEEGLALITANPSAWIDMPFPPMDVDVGNRMTDRGFFIQADGVELLALIIDEPREVPLDINPGQRLSITGGTLRGPDYMDQVVGVPLTAETEALVRDQQIYLVVDEAYITILEAGRPQTPPPGG